MTIQAALRRVVACSSMLALASSLLLSSLLIGNIKADQPSEANLVSSLDSSAPGSAHPLEPLLAMARAALFRIEREIQDYTCTLVKQERVSGELLPAETIFAKVRHAARPAVEASDNLHNFGLYLQFKAPEHLQGREILYQPHSEDDPLLVRNGGQRLAFLTLRVSPTCALAMSGNRYPVTEFGIARLVQRMINLGEQELAHGECLVNQHSDCRVDDRRCTCIEVIHPERRAHFAYHIARIYVDDQLQLPIRFEAYDWPAKPDDPPVLIEDYTYRELRLNVGLSDADFSADNPEYRFSKQRQGLAKQ